MEKHGREDRRSARDAQRGTGMENGVDVQPKGGDASVDDSSWTTIEPKGLLDRRGGGHLFMTWFRSNLTVPAKIGDFDTAGARARAFDHRGRLCGSLGQRSAAARHRTAKSRDHSGIQHAEPRHAQREREAWRQVPGSPSSRSTDPFRSRRPIPSSSGRRRSNSSSRRLVVIS